MIAILKDCFDKKGNRYKVVSFSGGRYQCQSYADGKSYYFNPNELSDKPVDFSKNTINFLKTKVESKPVEKAVEPIYDFTDEETSKVEIKEEPIVEEKVAEVIEKPVEVEKPKQEEKSKDNVKETAEDFYADF